EPPVLSSLPTRRSSDLIFLLRGIGYRADAYVIRVGRNGHGTVGTNGVRTFSFDGYRGYGIATNGLNQSHGAGNDGFTSRPVVAYHMDSNRTTLVGAGIVVSGNRTEYAGHFNFGFIARSSTVRILGIYICHVHHGIFLYIDSRNGILQLERSVSFRC